jgi:hypothetical protein
VPSPQSLVAFATTLLVLLVATRTQLDWSPLVSAIVSAVLAIGVGWIVNRYTPDDELDDVTEEVRDDVGTSPDANY